MENEVVCMLAFYFFEFKKIVIHIFEIKIVEY